jgi:hypothetical protein
VHIAPLKERARSLCPTVVSQSRGVVLSVVFVLWNRWTWDRKMDDRRSANVVRYEKVMDYGIC